MLINAQPAQVEQPLEGIKIVDKGQGLPQEKPFSQHLASILNQSTKQAITSNSMAKDKLATANDLSDSVVDVATLLDGKTISVDQIESVDPEVTFASEQLDESSLFDEPSLNVSENIDDSSNLPGLVNSNIDATSLLNSDDNASENLPGYQLDDSLDNPVLSQAQGFGYNVIDGASSPQNTMAISAGQNGAVIPSNASQAVNPVTASQQSSNQISSATHWGSSNSDGSQTFSSAQGGQSGSQPNGQQGAQSGMQPNAQPYMESAVQASQFLEKRSHNIEQLKAVKTTDELIVKADSKEGLLASDGLLGDKKTFLPPGMQSISVPVKSPQWGQAFGQRVVYMASNKMQQAQITLNPEKLGPVQVKLHMDKDQQMHVTMNAQHLTTREAMDNAIPRLREMLEQAGINLASVDVGEQSNFANNADSEPGSEKNTNSSVMNADSEGIDQPVTKTTVMSDNVVDFYA